MRIDHNFLDPALLEIELEKLKNFVPSDRASFRMLFGALKYVLSIIF